MNGTQRAGWKRIAFVAAIALVALLGNMRAAVSGGSATAVRLPSLAFAAQPDALPPSGHPASLLDSADVGDGTSAGRMPSPPKEDDVHLIPAIYAWDPDVRFVYYRHISKWM